jgi:hypothetical protein
MMRWKLVKLLPILALWACAEGGSRGSGISTTVEGNVVDAPFVGSTQTAIEGIRVTVEGTSAQGQTDANGDFNVRGTFDGQVSLVFQLPGDGGLARIAINVPAAGTLTLNNVRLDTERGVAIPATQDVAFEGIIAQTNCQAQILILVSVHDTPEDPDQYMLRLDTSSLQDSQGHPLTCEDLRGGESAFVQGTVNPDGTFGHATVEVDP